MNDYQPASRRPIAGLFRKTAYASVKVCVRLNVHPDAISYFSVVSAVAAAVCFWNAGAFLLLIPIIRDRTQGQLQWVSLSIVGFVYIGWMFGHLGFLAGATHAYGYVLYLLLANPGNTLIVFPEGTRSTSGTLNGFKAGIGLLVAGTDIPVIPCYIDGAYRAWPKGKAFPMPYKLRLMIGEPQTYQNYKTTKEDVLNICRSLEEKVNSLKPSPPFL